MQYAHPVHAVGLSEAMNRYGYYHISDGIVSIIYFYSEIKISHT